MSVSPKRPKGPPLNAMRAFEAAARHNSFVSAADELNVTAGAISQHVKTLESWAGTPLFRRNPQGVALTEAGAALVPDFTSAFDGLADAARALHNLKPNGDFHIAALPSVAQLWLPKRLSKIRAKLPNVNFSVTALEEPPFLSREMFDLSIFFAVPSGSPNQVPLCADRIAPVSAPDLQNSPVPFKDWTLLRDLTWQNDWPTWANSAQLDVPVGQIGPQFSLYSLAVEEAKAGAGVLMGHLCLVEDALSSGTLVLAHDHICQTGRSLVISLPHMARQRPETADVVALLSNQENVSGRFTSSPMRS